MRRIIIPTAAAAAMLAACHPARLGHARGAPDRPVSVAATLDCPDAQGDLTLSRRAGDGAGCSYAGPDGAQVVLTRMALTGGSAQATLAALDAHARALAPGAPSENAQAATTTQTQSDTDGLHNTTTTTLRTSSSRNDGDDADAPTPPAPPAPPAPPYGRDHAGDHVRLDLPGLHIQADGDHASVSGFGQHVEADDGGAVVHGDVGGMKSSVVANDHGATVRTGGAGSRSVDATLVLAGDAAGPDGWRSAGYVARGPLAGPLVVAQVQLRGENGGHGGRREGPFDAARRLVDRNTHR